MCNFELLVAEEKDRREKAMNIFYFFISTFRYSRFLARLKIFEKKS